MCFDNVLFMYRCSQAVNNEMLKNNETKRNRFYVEILFIFQK